MGTHNGGVDDQVFEVGTFHQCTEDTFPNAVPGPATEALEHAVPVAEHGRQVAPRRTGPRDLSGAELTRRISEVLLELKDRGVLDELRSKYFGRS